MKATAKKEKLKVEAKQFAAFITDISRVMEKHKVKHLLAVFGMNEQVRNSYLRTGEEKEDELYSDISDGIDSWLIINSNPELLPQDTSELEQEYRDMVDEEFPPINEI